MNKKVFVVIPTIRNLDFLRSWRSEFKQTVGIIVEDRLKKEISIPKNCFEKVYHYCWQDIERELGENSWIISRKNSGIRCFGFLKAFNLGADIIVTLDDDCYPVGNNFVKTHLENLISYAPEKWFSTFPHLEFNFTRGYPYKVRNKYPVVLSHGLWSGSIDLDAKTEIDLKEKLDIPSFNMPIRQFIPFGVYFPMCSMNLAFRREIVPLTYFPLMGEDVKGNKWGYDRYDDIWAGIFAKKIMDYLKMAVVVGSPLVKHIKKSNISKNFKREKSGMKTNEYLWQEVDRVKLTKDNVMGCYKELIEKINFPKEDYFKILKKAMRLWISMF